jgi:hypothetical protein
MRDLRIRSHVVEIPGSIADTPVRLGARRGEAQGACGANFGVYVCLTFQL